MPVCPSGHDSSTDDYCDVCGALMAGAAAVGATVPASAGTGTGAGAAGTAGVAGVPAGTAGVAAGGAGVSAAVPGTGMSATGVPVTGAPAAAAAGGGAGASGAAAQAESCPTPGCGAARTGRFCEECGYDFVAETGRPAAEPGAWTAVVAADRSYYDTVVAQNGPDAAALSFPLYCPERRIVLTGEQVRIGRRSRSREVTPEIDLGEPPEDPGVSHLHAVLIARPDGTWVLVDPGSSNGTTVNGASEPIAVNVETPLKNGDRIHVGAWTTITLHQTTP